MPEPRGSLISPYSSHQRSKAAHIPEKALEVKFGLQGGEGRGWQGENRALLGDSFLSLIVVHQANEGIGCLVCAGVDRDFGCDEVRFLLGKAPPA